MFSLNVPVPGRVKRITSELAPELYEFESVREHHAFVVKRFGEYTPSQYARLEGEVRRALADTPAFEARIDGIDAFFEPTSDPGPVVYLAVESPGLYALHARLVDRFGSIEGLEGEGYVPHVTLARGGSSERAERLRDREIDPVTWTVSRLVFWDAAREETVSSVSLPA